MSNEEAINQLEILLTSITGALGGSELSPYRILLAEKTIEALEKAKAVLGDKNLVKVVRCEKCIWYMREEGCPIGRRDLYDENGSLPHATDFCSYAEEEEK